MAEHLDDPVTSGWDKARRFQESGALQMHLENRLSHLIYPQKS